jgi:hypothetical protein
MEKEKVIQMLEKIKTERNKVELLNVGGQAAVNLAMKYNANYATVRDCILEGIALEDIEQFLREGRGLGYLMLYNKCIAEHRFTKALNKVDQYAKYLKRVNNRNKLLLKRKKRGLK